MPASLQSVTTRGFSISGGFTASVNLVTTFGYGISGVAPTPSPPTVFTQAQLFSKSLDDSNFRLQFVGDENFCDNLDDRNFKLTYFPME